MILACSETRIELPGQARFRCELTTASHVFALRDINHTRVRPNLDHEDIPRMPLLPRQ